MTASGLREHHLETYETLFRETMHKPETVSNTDVAQAGLRLIEEYRELTGQAAAMLSALGNADTAIAIALDLIKDQQARYSLGRVQAVVQKARTPMAGEHLLRERIDLLTVAESLKAELPAIKGMHTRMSALLDRMEKEAKDRT